MASKTKRQSLILDRVANGGSLEIAELSAELRVTGETIRRDIRELQARGLVRKIHGGVTLPPLVTDGTFHERMKDNSEGKRRIAEAIASFVQDGDALIIETGTTATYVAQALSAKRRLTVVTNSVDVARALAFHEDNAVYMAGGRLTPADGAALDHTAAGYMASFRVKYAIFSVAGVDPVDGLMANNVAEAEFTRLVGSRAEIPVLAVDASKFGRRGLVRVVEPAAVGIVVTDRVPPKPFAPLFEGVDLRIA